MSRPTATKFEHAGVEITLLDNGKFSATVQGNKTVKQSLDAMKKHIDAHAEAGKLAEVNARLRAEVDETNALLARSVRDNAAYEVIRKRDSQRIATLTAALSKINDVRNSIIGSQQVNWSEHVYPLVAALNAAGIEGMEYPAAKERFATTMEQIATLTAERDVARSNYGSPRQVQDRR